MYSLKTLAEDLGGYVHGDESIVVDRLATLKGAKSGQLSFLSMTLRTQRLQRFY